MKILSKCCKLKFVSTFIIIVLIRWGKCAPSSSSPEYTPEGHKTKRSANLMGILSNMLLQHSSEPEDDEWSDFYKTFNFGYNHDDWNPYKNLNQQYGYGNKFIDQSDFSENSNSNSLPSMEYNPPVQTNYGVGPYIGMSYQQDNGPRTTNWNVDDGENFMFNNARNADTHTHFQEIDYGYAVNSDSVDNNWNLVVPHKGHAEIDEMISHKFYVPPPVLDINRIDNPLLNGNLIPGMQGINWITANDVLMKNFHDSPETKVSSSFQECFCEPAQRDIQEKVISETANGQVARSFPDEYLVLLIKKDQVVGAQRPQSRTATDTINSAVIPEVACSDTNQIPYNSTERNESEDDAPCGSNVETTIPSPNTITDTNNTEVISSGASQTFCNTTESNEAATDNMTGNVNIGTAIQSVNGTSSSSQSVTTTITEIVSTNTSQTANNSSASNEGVNEEIAGNNNVGTTIQSVNGTMSSSQSTTTTTEIGSSAGSQITDNGNVGKALQSANGTVASSPDGTTGRSTTEIMYSDATQIGNNSTGQNETTSDFGSVLQTINESRTSSVNANTTTITTEFISSSTSVKFVTNHMESNNRTLNNTIGTVGSVNESSFSNATTSTSISETIVTQPDDDDEELEAVSVEGGIIFPTSITNATSSAEIPSPVIYQIPNSFTILSQTMNKSDSINVTTTLQLPQEDTISSPSTNNNEGLDSESVEGGIIFPTIFTSTEITSPSVDNIPDRSIELNQTINDPDNLTLAIDSESPYEDILLSISTNDTIEADIEPSDTSQLTNSLAESAVSNSSVQIETVVKDAVDIVSDPPNITNIDINTEVTSSDIIQNANEISESEKKTSQENVPAEELPSTNVETNPNGSSNDNPEEIDKTEFSLID